MSRSYIIRHWVYNNPIITIVLVGLATRILIIALYQHITLYPDSNDYIILAKRLLDFNLSGYEGERSPGYPLLLCLAAVNNIATIIFQLLIGICTLVITYKTLITIGIKKQASLLVTIAINFYLPIIFFELAILSETLTLFFISLIFYFLFKILYTDEKARINSIAVAICCAYLVLIKPFYIFLPFILFFFLSLSTLQINTFVKKYTLLLILPLTIFLGWSYINKINTGYFVATTFYGFNIAQNCVSFAENTPPKYKETGEIYARHRDNRLSEKEIAMTIWEAYPELEEKTGLSFPDLSKKLYDYSIATIKLNPIAYLKQVFISWRDFWKTSLYWEPQNIGFSIAEKPLIYIIYAERIFVQIIKVLFVIFIPFNILVWIRRRKINPSLIISIVVFSASILQALLTYGTNSRFSFPFEILISISALINILQIFTFYKRGKIRL